MILSIDRDINAFNHGGHERSKLLKCKNGKECALGFEENISPHDDETVDLFMCRECWEKLF